MNLSFAFPMILLLVFSQLYLFHFTETSNSSTETREMRSALLVHNNNASVVHTNISEPPLAFDTNLHRNISFIHVGKAGGMTIRKMLNINMKKCGSGTLTSEKNRGLARSIQSCHHLVVRPNLANDVHRTSFLFSIREPISRVVSAFNYGHYANNQYYKEQQIKKGGAHFGFYHFCFPSVEDLAMAVGGSDEYRVHDNKVVTTAACRRLGKRVLRGYSPKVVAHLHANYNFYTEKTIYRKNEANKNHPKDEVLVIRTEHQLDDMARLNRWLGGGDLLTSSAGRRRRQTKKNKKAMPHTHGSEQYAVTSGVSKQGSKALCCAIYKELVIYQDLVNSATNLHDVEKDETMALSYQTCGMDDIEGSARISFSWYSWYKETC